MKKGKLSCTVSVMNALNFFTVVAYILITKKINLALANKIMCVLIGACIEVSFEKHITEGQALLNISLGSTKDCLQGQ